MLLGEVIFGGLGTGLLSMILVALIGVFVGGMMVGRPPEYLGKPIGPPEMKLISLYALLGPATILLLTALAAVTAWGLAGLTTNSGPHGLSEIVYAYASSLANNGQNFAGLNANTPFYNITTALAMMAGPFWPGHPGPGAGGASRAPTPPAGVARDPADGYAALCGLVDGDDRDCRWLELLTSPRPGASSRASARNVRAPWHMLQSWWFHALRGVSGAPRDKPRHDTLAISGNLSRLDFQRGTRV